MVIVETNEHAQQVLAELEKQEVVVVPIFEDQKKHPSVNNLSVLGIATRTDRFVIGLNHVDAQKVDFEILQNCKFQKSVWTPDKKSLLQVLPNWSLEDFGSVEYLCNKEPVSLQKFWTTTHTKFHDKFHSQDNLNTLVPLMKHVEVLDSCIDHMWNFIEENGSTKFIPAYTFLSDIAIPALTFIEKSGLQVDETVFSEKFGERAQKSVVNGRVFSQYNLYTTTGRCSNRFGGINYAALNKKDGIRASFVSRFPKGVLVSADFESFHLRLIADMIDFKFPEGIPIHEYLGHQYFGKSSLTPEEYEESKRITFKLLYSEDRQHRVPEFFQRVYDYVDTLTTLMDRRGYILSPYFKREIRSENIEDPTPQKVFNYMIQLAETELNLHSINQIRPLFEGKSSCPILYTYDSLLFDYNWEEDMGLLQVVIDVLSRNGQFPMRVYYGKDYHNLKRLEL